MRQRASRCEGGPADSRRSPVGRVVATATTRCRTRRSIRAAARLVPEPENEHDPNAVGIWNEERTLQVGYVPALSIGAPSSLARRGSAVSLVSRVGAGGTCRSVCELRARARRLGSAQRLASAPGRSTSASGVAYEFKLPDLGEGLTEGEIARWLVTEGQDVAEDDPLVEIQTDKTTVEIPRRRPGVARILVGEGDVVPVGTVLVVIGRGAGTAPRPLAGGQPRRHPSGRAGSRDAARPAARAGARRRPRELRRDRRRRDGSPKTTCARGAAGGSPRTCPGGTARAAAGRPAADRGAHDARAPRGRRRSPGSRSATSANVDLELLVATTLKAMRALAAGVPGAERAAGGRRDRPASTATTSASPSRPSRGSSCPSSATATRARSRSSTPRCAASPRPPAPARSSRRSSEARPSRSRAPASSRASSRRRSSTTRRSRSSASAGSPTARSSATARSSSRPLGHVALTFDHRVVDGARAAEFGLAVIRRLEQPVT